MSLFVLYWAVIIVGIVIAVGGGMLALYADPERPAQCIPVFVIAGSVFLGGMALVLWYQPVADGLRGLGG